MKNNRLVSWGLVGSIISTIILLIASSKYSKAKGQYDLALDRYDLDTMYAWSDDLNAAKVILIISGIILVISIICLIAGFLNNAKVSSVGTQINNESITEKMKSLQQMYNEGLITEGDYQSKKEELLKKL